MNYRKKTTYHSAVLTLVLLTDEHFKHLLEQYSFFVLLQKHAQYSSSKNHLITRNIECYEFVNAICCSNNEQAFANIEHYH